MVYRKKAGIVLMGVACLPIAIHSLQKYNSASRGSAPLNLTDQLIRRENPEESYLETYFPGNLKLAYDSLRHAHGSINEKLGDDLEKIKEMIDSGDLNHREAYKQTDSLILDALSDKSIENSRKNFYLTNSYLFGTASGLCFAYTVPSLLKRKRN